MRRRRATGWFVLIAIGIAISVSGAEKPTTQPSKPARVVYVIDASGSMLGPEGARWRATITEVAKSLDSLQADDYFAVLLELERGKIKRLVGMSLLRATEQNKQAVWEALRDHQPNGTDSTVAGIQAAAKLRPTLVWLVSDGSLHD